MTPVVPFSVSNAALVPGIPFVSRKTNCLTRRNSLRKTTTKKFALKKNFVPLSALVGTFHGYKTVLSVPGLRMHTLAASGTEVAVQESDPATVGEDASGISEVEPSALETSETPSLSAQANDTPNIKSKRSRPVRKSEMPPVKNEDLVPGATFMGKVRSIQPFGAFVDFGAFTDGLVHVSRLSNSFVKDVGSVVSIGQEVKVKLVEVSTETGRISLSMRESDDTGKLQQRKDAAASGDKPRTTRRNGTKSNQKSSKFVKGQDLQGTVKSLNRAGAFIALPEGEEGFLPTSEESEEGLADMMGGSMLQVGQEVGVKVLRITRGQVTLTMKKEENDEMLNSSQGVVHAATNPFLLAFRKNKEIAAFLDERDKVLNSAKTAVTSKTSGDLEGKVNQTEMEIAIPEVPDQPKSSEEDLVTVSSASDKVVEDVKTFSGDEENRLEAASVILDAPSVVPESGNEKTEGAVSSSLHSFDASKEAMLEEEVVPEMVTPEASVPSESQIPEDASITDVLKDDGKSDPAGEMSGDQILSSEIVDGKKFAVSQVDVALASGEEQVQAPLIVENNVSSAMLNDHEKEVIKSQPEASVPPESQIPADASETDVLKDDGKSDPAGELSVDQILSSESVDSKKFAESQVNVALVSDEEQVQAPLIVENNVSAISNEHEKEVTKSQPDNVPANDELDIQEPPNVVNEVLPATSNEDEKEDQILSSESVDSKKFAESQVNVALVSDEEQVQAPLIVENNVSSAMSNEHEKEVTKSQPDNVPTNDELEIQEPPNVVNEVLPATSDEDEKEDQILSSESVDSKKFAESQVNVALVRDEEQAQAPLIVENNVSSAMSNEHEKEGQPDNIPAYDELEIQEPPNVVNEVIPATSNEDEKEVVKSPKKHEVQTETQLTMENEVILATSGKDEEEVRENQADGLSIDQVPTQASLTMGDEVSSATSSEPETLPSTPEKNGNVINSNGQADGSPQPNSTKATISPALVKQLREETGAGMMDCKNALSETGGDIVKAQEHLRKKGLASADKKASRVTAEGRIGSYIHDSRIGVLIEVNCETDFVSRGDIFKDLIDDLAMQVAACPQVQYINVDDVPEEIVNKEREIEMQKEDLLSKPEQIRSKIVEGRISKRLGELALLEQPYIKNDKLVVKDWVKQTIATIGENVKVNRFVRYNLGEGLEKKSQDFAAEVAAQTAAKPFPAAPGKDKSTTTEAKESVEKPPTVTVSAALVKQLREETGAGMMDCKRALAETGGNLEKAQEYLRKKGLSSADKKSSRLAAEGRIGSYIHDSRIGVLIEVNCETDFVGRSEKFKELVEDLAMQVVACPQVQFVSIEDIPESMVNKEKELEMQREDLLSKPENIREKIVEGRVSKRLGEVALLEQPFIKNDSLLVKDLVKQTVASLGENIKVRRFVRFTLGDASKNGQTAT